MRYFRVNMSNTLGASVYVEVPDEVIQRVADEHEVDVDDVTVEMLRDVVEEAGFSDTPSLCAHCNGMGFGANFVMDINGEWAPEDEDWHPSKGYPRPDVVIEIGEDDDPSSSRSYVEAT